MSLEMDSFILKFKNLWKSGRNANLTIKSNAGKAEVVLRVELEEPADHAHLQHPHHRARNSPAWQRRREKRAEACEAAATDVAENVTTEEAISEDHNATGNETTQVVSNDVTEKSEKDDSKSATAIGEVADEICSDEHYDKVVEAEKELKEYFRVVFLNTKVTITEDAIVKDILKRLDSNFKKAKIKKPDEIYEFVKSGKLDGKVRVFIKAKNIPDVLKSIKNLESENIEVMKMPKWRR